MSGYTIEQRKQRWRDFLDPAKPPQHLFHIGFDPDAPPAPLPWPTLKAERIEWSWQRYVRQMKTAEWLNDDRVPSLTVGTGTEIFAAAFGCPVMRPDDDMPYARPLLTGASQVAKLPAPDIGAPSLADLFEIGDELRARGGKDVLLGMVDIQSPMDVAALIWDKNDFYVAMLEAPEAVKELAHRVLALQTAFFDAWFARYGPDFIAHCPYYYIPRGVTLSEDEVGIVNAEMFTEFYLPELAALSARYGALGMHCCANSRHQWDNFKKIPNLQLLNITQPPEVTRQAYSFFADHCIQYHGALDGPAWEWPAKLPPGSRVVIDVYPETEDQAREAAEKLWTACGRE